MASLPPQPNPQPRRASPEQNLSASSQSQSSSSSGRTRSDEAPPLFQYKPAEETSTAEPTATADQQQEQQQAPPANPADDPNVKKCWICFSDSTEDTLETSPWRSPCPCALVAHEECLLDWIADMEAPNNRRNNQGIGGPKIECPQCKTEIKLARPRDLVVEAVRGIENLGGQLVTPGAVTVLLGTVYQSSMVWGIHSIFSVFGAEDGDRILRPLLVNYVRPPIEIRTRRDFINKLLAVSLDRLARWRLYVGVPLITPILVLSRTSLADSVLPMLPIMFFATQTVSSGEPLDFGAWPPSASMAFAALPYIRSAYNTYYKRVWAPKEKQWLREIQPRVTQDATNAEQGAEAGNEGLGALAARPDDDNIFEVRIDGWDDFEDDDENLQEAVNEAVNNEMNDVVVQPPAQGEQNPNANQQDQPAQNQQNNQQALPEQQPRQAQQQAPAAPAVGERRLSFSPTAIAETVLGALLFPSIAGMSGELLKWCLPRSWTTPVYVGRGYIKAPVAKGLLQAKWGRSLVGGCLFVVLKDAVMLYVRWRMAQMHRRRKVVEWKDRKERRSRATANA